MSKDQKSGSLPVSMPAPQLPNIPISPDDPFQSDPEQLPPVKAPPDPDPTPSGYSQQKLPGHAPKCDELEDPEAA
jgi:hypothetical protein